MCYSLRVKIKITVECQGCKKADATKKAVMLGAPETEEWAWKLCDKCAAQKTPGGGQAWVIIGEMKPIIKDV